MVCTQCSWLCQLREDEVVHCGTPPDGHHRLHDEDRSTLTSAVPVPIEALGFFHVLPGSRTLASAAGRTPPHFYHCFADDPAGGTRRGGATTREPCSSEELVAIARLLGCRSITFPWVRGQRGREVFAYLRAARRSGLYGLLQVDGIVHPDLLDQLRETVDGVGVAVATLTDPVARRLGFAPPHVVRENLRRLRDLGIWVEVTTVIVPGLNDREADLVEIASSLAALSPLIPWHVRQVGWQPPWWGWGKPEGETVHRAIRIAERVGLAHVYAAGIEGGCHELTFCPVCRDVLLIERFLGRPSCRLDEGHSCPRCRTRAHGLFEDGSPRGREASAVL